MHIPGWTITVGDVVCWFSIMFLWAGAQRWKNAVSTNSILDWGIGFIELIIGGLLLFSLFFVYFY